MANRKLVFGLFYKNSKGTWVGPANGELYSLEDIIYNSGIDESASLNRHVEACEKGWKAHLHRKVRLMKQCWLPTTEKDFKL